MQDGDVGTHAGGNAQAYQLGKICGDHRPAIEATGPGIAIRHAACIGVDVLRHRVTITSQAGAGIKNGEMVSRKILDELPGP